MRAEELGFNKEYVEELLISLEVALVSPFSSEDLLIEVKEIACAIKKEVDKDNDENNNKSIEYALCRIIEATMLNLLYDTKKDIYIHIDYIRKILGQM